MMLASLSIIYLFIYLFSMGLLMQVAVHVRKNLPSFDPRPPPHGRRISKFISNL